MGEIINADGSRNWEANILFDNIKRLEQKNTRLKEKIKMYKSEDTRKHNIIMETSQHDFTIYGIR